MKYASFGRRFVAHVVDMLVFLPFQFVGIWAWGNSKAASLLLLLPLTLATLVYVVVCHALWGQTLGKRFARIRVVQSSGEPIGWREATRRSSVDLGFACIAVIGMAISWGHIPEGEWGGGLVGMARRSEAFEPAWFKALNYAGMAWAWSELLVMLTNQKRRALHDLIAGTVVVRLARAPGDDDEAEGDEGEEGDVTRPLLE